MESSPRGVQEEGGEGRDGDSRCGGGRGGGGVIGAMVVVEAVEHTHTHTHTRFQVCMCREKKIHNEESGFFPVQVDFRPYSGAFPAFLLSQIFSVSMYINIVFFLNTLSGLRALYLNPL